MKRLFSLLSALVPLFGAVFALTACASPAGPAAAGAGVGEGRPTVFLISIDGVRPDYVARAETPFLDRLMAEGAYSLAMTGPFPTVTFQSHAAMATGARAEVHGITGNAFYDSATGETYRYAGDMALLQAEPFWITAERAGVRTLVFDWVNAHNQTGPITASYFGSSYMRGLSDEQRVARVLSQWREDRPADGGEPLRFVLAYTESPDKEGHRHGPDAPEVDVAMAEIDALLARTYEEAKALWQRDRRPGDSFWFIVVSDHGMAPIATHVHFRRALGLEDWTGITTITTGTVGHLFVDGITDPARREAKLAKARHAFESHEVGRVHARDNLPSHWGYAHPTRTGDLVFELYNEHSYSARVPGGQVTVSSEGTTFLGTHGYDAVREPRMATVAFYHRYPEPLGGRDLGAGSLLDLNPTVLRILGTTPPPTAEREGLRFE